MPTKGVAKRLFDSVLATNHIFLMKQDGTRLENKTPREIMNMDRKLGSKDCSEGYVSSIKVKRRANTASKTLSCKLKQPGKFC